MAVTDETRRLAQARRDELDELSNAAVTSIAQRWVATWDSLQGELAAMIDDLGADNPDGITATALRRAERLERSMGIARERLDELAAHVHGTVLAEVEPIVASEPPHVATVLSSQLPAAAGTASGAAVPAAAAQVSLNFTGPDEDSLANIVARTTTRIEAATDPLPEHMETAMRDRLVTGIAGGDNPRDVATRVLSDVEGDFNGGLARASRMARTEMLDAQRAANHATAQANPDLIQGKVWHATASARTCMSCIAMAGTVFPPDAFGPEDHPNGRCVFIDKLPGWSELGIPELDGLDEPDDEPSELGTWFDGLTEDTQRRMLGPTRQKLLADGDISLDDLPTRVENPDWRASYHLRSAADLERLAQSRRDAM